MDSDRKVRVTFFMEQHAGHRTFFLNLRKQIDRVPTLHATWVPITYVPSFSLWSRIPKIANIAGTLAGRRQVLRSLSTHEADILFFFTQVPAALAVRQVSNLPYVLCTDITPRQYDRFGDQYNHKSDSPGSLLSIYKHHVNLELFQKAAKVIAWSDWVAESLETDYRVASDRIVTIPPGIDTQLWQPRPKLQRERSRILFVGNDFVRKGGRELLDACKQLPSDKFELIVVSHADVQMASDVEVHSNLSPNSSKLIKLFQSADIFVLPSRAEAFGQAALEAGACGLPVIVTNVGGLAETVRPGETGFLIDPGDRKGLLEALGTLLSKPQLRREMGQANHHRVLQKFDAATNSYLIAEILRGVAKHVFSDSP